MIRRCFNLIVIILLMAGCAFDSSDTVKQIVDDRAQQHVMNPVILIGTVWRLQELEGETPNYSDLQNIPYILLEEDRTVRGSGGCNDFKGSYTLRGQQLQIIRNHEVRIACMVGLEQENRIFSVLDSTVAYEMEGEQLKLLDENETVLAVFSAGIQTYEKRTE